MSAVSFDKFPPAEEPATADDDIFGAFGVEEPETDDGRVVAIIEEDFMGTGKRFFVAIDGNHVEEFDSIEAAREAIPEWKKYLAEEQTLQAAAPVKPAKEPKAKPLCAVCNNVAVNKNSPVLDGQKVCKKCHLESDLPKPTEEAATGSGDADPKSQDVSSATAPPTAPESIVAAAAPSTATEAAPAQDATTAQTPADADTTHAPAAASLCPGPTDPKQDAPGAEEPSASTSTESDTGTQDSALTALETLSNDRLSIAEEGAEIEERHRLMTEAGLIDPITGEVLEPSLIMRKFGWTELPVLRQDATREEADAFERKLDQVLDKVASHQEKAARRRAAAELRCKPHDSAAEFWFNEFATPMAKMLAPHRLQRMKNGEYKSKTMVLDSGAVKFTQAGGWSVHDAALVKSYIEKEGVEKFTAIGAKREITYSYPKLVGALNKGVFKDIPGTVKRAKDPFAKVQMVALSGPKTKEGAEEDSE